MEYTEEIKKEADSVVINIISKIKKSLGSMVFSEFWLKQIQSLTQQINYLKNKL